MSVFPSWFLKLPIASSHNYKIMADRKLLEPVVDLTNTYPDHIEIDLEDENDENITDSGLEDENDEIITESDLTDKKEYKITQESLEDENDEIITESAVTMPNGNLTLTMSIPYERRPVDREWQTSKYECDRTCTDCLGYKDTHFGNTWTITMKNATKKCITWKFAGGNLDAADFHLKINGLTNEYAYRITQSGIAVLNGNVTITITIPKMKRPVIWECHDYTNECDRTCLNGNYYIVRHIVNTSTLSVTAQSKKCSIWKFNDVNLNAADIHLKIEETKSLSLFGFPSWYLKLPIASSYNYKV